MGEQAAPLFFDGICRPLLMPLSGSIPNLNCIEMAAADASTRGGELKA